MAIDDLGSRRAKRLGLAVAGTLAVATLAIGVLSAPPDAATPPRERCAARGAWEGRGLPCGGFTVNESGILAARAVASGSRDLSPAA